MTGIIASLLGIVGVLVGVVVGALLTSYVEHRRELAHRRIEIIYEMLQPNYETRTQFDEALVLFTNGLKLATFGSVDMVETMADGSLVYCYNIVDDEECKTTLVVAIKSVRAELDLAPVADDVLYKVVENILRPLQTLPKENFQSPKKVR